MFLALALALEWGGQLCMRLGCAGHSNYDQIDQSINNQSIKLSVHQLNQL